MIASPSIRAAVVALMLAACGGGPTAGPHNAEPSKTAEKSSKAGSDGDEQLEPHEIPDGARVPSVKLIDRRARTALAPDSLSTVKSAKPPKSSGEVYRSVAPATVIIRVADGMGSGVIIDPKGWVLTNHHVIATGEAKDFKVKVTVLLGHLSKDTGSMQRDEKTYEAYVYKADKLRDIALLKIISPPKKLPYAKLAKKKPTPGDEVLAIGHAGAGMLWALKSGEISALGKLSEQLAMLAKFKEDDEGKEAAKSFREFLDKQHLGFVIQSTCNILPGDSGGPLVNRQGEVVGLNAFSRRDPRTGGLLSFHVHLDEIAKLNKNRPTSPMAMLPDPWEEGGGDANFEDADLDGRIDVLLLRGRRPCLWCPRQSSTIFVDADQNSYKSRRVPKLKDVYEKRDFDAELAYLQIKKDSYIWYDTDDDGKFDVLLVDKGTTGRVTGGYKLGAANSAARESDLSTGRPIRGDLIENPEIEKRLRRIVAAAFPSRYTSSSAPLSATLPEPLAAKVGSGRVRDMNKDGQGDALFVQAPFSTRLIVDADQSFVPKLMPVVDMSKLSSSGMMDAEVVSVSQGTHTWVWYDTDDDAKFDLALHAPGMRDYVAVDAWRVDASGKKSRAPEHEGRKLMRPDLMADKAITSSLKQMAKGGMLKIMSALEDDGLGSFPSPTKDHRGAGFELLDKKPLPKGVISVQARGSDGFLIDLDQNSFRGKARKNIDVKKAIDDDKLDVEFAFMQRNGLAWAFYDTDNKKGFDLVLYTGKPRIGVAQRGYRVDAKNVVTRDDSFEGKPMVRPSLFKRKRDQKKFGDVAKELFRGNLLEQ